MRRYDNRKRKSKANYMIIPVTIIALVGLFFLTEGDITEETKQYQSIEEFKDNYGVDKAADTQWEKDCIHSNFWDNTQMDTDNFLPENQNLSYLDMLIRDCGVP